MKWVLASSNPGKLAELNALLGDEGFTLVTQGSLGVDDVPETGLTFIENALIKARHAAQATGLPALADDSGLCVDALNGAPGLYSARYAGPGAGAQANIDKLLGALEGVPDEARTAHFHAVLVLLRAADDPQPLVVEGRWHGRVLHARRGDGGFGYDPVFLDPASGLSAAELDAATKNRVSHRGQALAELKARLRTLSLNDPLRPR
ncbi:nucleoside-triphosphate diphosphatase [Lysobacter daejeonensis GH1-9]|uniref:dITP/XTP pyrophosphatase n=1 Tax=Lysobacter daejeonensis GH1-9 TaxID=1385517 RepID=A0A0A0EZ60_9GAMM|nr:RdgB/HAM1 family non-canonical purine NTP pyrophosphatase [Lysobacter daejeonensis]KGM55323.1 nucleoside-triphosphate diphosphatase [Lysobacter daejeonensis GH1-9]